MWWFLECYLCWLVYNGDRQDNDDKQQKGYFIVNGKHRKREREKTERIFVDRIGHRTRHIIVSNKDMY